MAETERPPERLREARADRIGTRVAEPAEPGFGQSFSEALIRSSLDGILAFDRDYRYTIWNPAMERLSGLPVSEVLGRQAFEVFPFLAATGEDHFFREALGGRHAVALDRAYSFPETGRQGYFDGHYSPLLDASGEIVGGLGIIRDITERKQAEEGRRRLLREQTARAEAEAAGQRLALLSEISRDLSGSLDAEETLARLARLVVPALADYCIIDVFDEEGEIRSGQTVHKDARGQELIDEVRRRYPPKVGATAGMGLVLRTGEPIFAPVVTEPQLRAAAQDEGHLRLLLEIGPRSSILVPLMHQGRILGAIAFALVEAERHYGPADLALFEELGLRTALAVDNARLYRQAQEALAELAAADRRKDEFLAMLAHELRNPLGAIANAGQLLDMRRSEDPVSHELLAVIHRQIRHLSRMVDDLLDVSRFTRGRIELHRTAVDLRPLIAGAADTVRPMVEERRHRLLVSLPDEPLWIEADATRIEQVLTNLLSNAAKFTDPGGNLSIAAERRDGLAAVSVSDDGPGIPPDLLPRIFDLFVQEDRSLARSHGGLGIGLTLVRSLVERHGGSVEAHSEGHGTGSRFTLHLPLIPAPSVLEPPPPRGVPAEPPESSEATARILLVEDNHDAADALGELLRLWGHQVEIAHEGFAALDAASTRPPEVVLLDIGLPGMDGFEVAEALRRLPGLDRALLIALTGYGQETDRRRSSEAGFDHHLVKPVDLEQLRRLIVGQPAYRQEGSGKAFASKSQREPISRRHG